MEEKKGAPLNNGSVAPMESFPGLGIEPNSIHVQIHCGSTGRKMLYEANRPASPTAEVREALMVFREGDTRAPGLSQNQRVHLLGQCTDLNAIYLMDGGYDPATPHPNGCQHI